jgi:hypothetical protein
MLRATRNSAVGWLVVTAVCVAAVGAGYILWADGVTWDPQPGPPWRGGTLLGGLLRFL